MSQKSKSKRNLEELEAELELEDPVELEEELGETEETEVEEPEEDVEDVEEEDLEELEEEPVEKKPKATKKTTKKSTTKKTTATKGEKVKKERKQPKENTVPWYRRQLIDAGYKLGSDYLSKNDLIAKYNEHFDANISIKKKKKKKEPLVIDGVEVHRPNTAYIIFGGDARPFLKTKYPDIAVTEIAKHLGVIWRCKSEAELKEAGFGDKEIVNLWKKKSQYEADYKKKKKEHDELVAKHKGAQPQKPKRGRSNYILFSSDVRPKIKEENPDASSTEITSLIAQSWREASDDVKAKYTNLQAEDKARYEAENAEYENKYGKPEKKSKKAEAPAKKATKKTTAPAKKSTAPAKKAPAKKSAAPAKKVIKATKKTTAPAKKSATKKTTKK